MSEPPASEEAPSGQHAASPPEHAPIAGQLDVNWTLDTEELEAAEKPSVPAPSISLDVHRETTRSRLALWLMALLTGTVFTILLLAGLDMSGVIDSGEGSLRDLGQIVLTPVVTLTGTALGFYFGAQSAAGALGEPGGFLSPRKPGVLRRLLRWIW